LDDKTAGPLQPGTSPLHAGVSLLVFRLANAAAGLNNQNRMANDVAAINLVLEALHRYSLSDRLELCVYGWGSAAGNAGSNAR
jgi:hypothetical protein